MKNNVIDIVIFVIVLLLTVYIRQVFKIQRLVFAT